MSAKRKKKGGRVTLKGTGVKCKPRSLYLNRDIGHKHTTRMSDSKGTRIICSWCGDIKTWENRV